MTTAEHRKAIPLGVRLHACLLLLGFSEEEIRTPGAIHWDHEPALGIRPVVDGVMTPAPNDPRYLRPMRNAEHMVKTNGTKATSAGSDKNRAAKVKRLDRTADEHAAALRRKMLAADHLAEAAGYAARKPAWPKGRKIQSRGFQRKEPPRGT